MINPKNKDNFCFDQKDKDIVSVSTFTSSEPLVVSHDKQELDFSFQSSDIFYRADVFCLKEGLKKIGPKTNRSAVNWIQTNCWIKNFDLDTTVLSIILYYAYCLSHDVDKSKL